MFIYERGFSSPGRAPALQAGCKEFDPPNLQCGMNIIQTAMIFDITRTKKQTKKR